MRRVWGLLLICGGCECGAPPLVTVPDAGACTAAVECGSSAQCFRPCLDDGGLGACQGPSGPVEVQNDPLNCGACGRVCPAPVHAQVRCAMGACGRSPCEGGWFDLEPLVPG